MASGNLIGCKVHGLALAYSSMDGWVCIIFSKQLSIYIYIYILYIPSTYVCFQKNTRERWGNAWVVGYNCLHNQVYIFSNRYIHIPRTSKYHEKILKLWKLCGKLVNYLFYADLEGLGYTCVSAWKKIYPWRHSNCWLPNSFILGGGEAFKVLKCW